MTRTLKFGEHKYSRGNWRLGGPKTSKIEILKSLQRHVGELIDAVNEGRPEIDEDSGEHLIGNIGCNVMFYAYHHVINKKEVKKKK
jgi:hypothetical protein